MAVEALCLRPARPAGGLQEAIAEEDAMDSPLLPVLCFWFIFSLPLRSLDYNLDNFNMVMALTTSTSPLVL